MERLLSEHLVYITDRVRNARFAEAIRAVVAPGARVADLGCGAGILGLMALQAGAGHVYAVDYTDIVDVARETFTRAGWGHRVTCIQGHTRRVELPEPVDVLLCDHVGCFGFDYGILSLLRDAKQRYLAPGGVVVPTRLAMVLAAVESEPGAALAHAWARPPVAAEFHWLAEHDRNRHHLMTVQRSNLLSAPVELGTLDFRGELPESVSWTVDVVVERDGVVHGFGGWFECALTAGVHMTNSPLSDSPIQRPQAFLPIDGPEVVVAGDHIEVTIKARPDAEVLAWSGVFTRTGRRFMQSNWQGMVVTARNLARANPARVPRPTPDGRARSIVLGYCDGQRTARDVEQAVLQDHPTLLPSRAEISHFVADVLSRDTT